MVPLVNLSCSQLAHIVHTLPMVTGCDVVRNGALRMATPFLYPNGDRIDVFLQESHSLFDRFLLSDYGHTSLYLRNAQVDPEKSEGKREAMARILSQLGVESQRGDLMVSIPSHEPADLSDAIFRLSQACLRISDFAAHQRLRAVNPFRDKVESFLGSTGIGFVPNVEVAGRFNNKVKVDFEVFGQTQNSYMAVLASSNESAAHSSSNEIFRKWYDIGSELDAGQNRVTVYNSQNSALKDADRRRLREWSRLIAFPHEQEELKELLAA